MAKLEIVVVAASMALSGCMSVDAQSGGQPVALEAETIIYETAPCFGACPVYTVIMMPDGRGTFEGKRYTAVTGIKSFSTTQAVYRAFAAKLAPYRPTDSELLYQPGTPNCENAPTDMPSVDVVWTELSGGRQHLNVYYGCGPVAMREALRSAPSLLPIAAFIGDGHK